jgi:hypothetical protein
MPNERGLSCGVVEGSGGSYNRPASIPARGGNLALPFLEQAVKNITFDEGDQPVVIADGSSQGKTSPASVRGRDQSVTGTHWPDRPIFVVHIDQTVKDFNTLFEVLHRDPKHYSVDDPNIFPSAFGGSFYESLFPAEHVHFGWSYAAVWLSRIPIPILGHFILFAGAGDVGDAFERRAADDWRFLLSLWANEFRANEALAAVVAAGVITAAKQPPRGLVRFHLRPPTWRLLSATPGESRSLPMRWTKS